MRTGKIIQVSGSVVDVRFPHGELPRIREALSVELNGKRLVMEVEQHLSAETVRCIMLSGSEGLSRCDRQTVIKMNVCNQWNMDLFLDRRDRCRCRIIIYGASDDITACLFKF